MSRSPVATAPRPAPPRPEPVTSRPPPPHQPPVRAGAAAALCLVVAGTIGGLGHLHPQLWALAWIGVALTAAALRLPRALPWLAFALVSGGLAEQWIGHPTSLATLWGMLRNGTALTCLAFLVISLLVSLLTRGPLILGAALAGDSLPSWIWLPVAWWAGESLNEGITGLSHGAWLYSQWQVPAVLRATGNLGWTGALLLCVCVAAAAGEALAARSLPATLVAATGIACLWMLPALPGDLPSALAHTGAVHMSSYLYPPRQAPPGITLLVWPEITRGERPWLEEGPGQGRSLDPPLDSPTTSHLVGYQTHSRLGLQNAVVALDPAGRVLSVRAKRRLFPIVERAFLGLGADGRYAPGHLLPVLTVAGLQVAPLLCFEQLDRRLAAAGKAAGARLLTISSIDSILDADSSPVVRDQLLAMAVLRAAETGLPVVRASRGGPSALIAPDGRVLMVSRPGTDGVLTLASDYP